MQLLGTDFVHRADHTAQHMIEAVIAARTLDRAHITRLAHHANPLRIARGILADAAFVRSCVIEAATAEMHLLLDFQDSLGQATCLLGIGLEQVVRDALGALGTDPRKAPQLIKQLLQTVIGTHAKKFL